MSCLSLDQAVLSCNLEKIVQAIASGAQPDRETYQYSMSKTTHSSIPHPPNAHEMTPYYYYPGLGEPTENSTQIYTISTKTFKFFLTYTKSSLKQAIKTQNINVIKAVINTGAWLYGVEKKTQLYSDIRNTDSSSYEQPFSNEYEYTKIDFGKESEWNSHLQKAERFCGGRCDEDALDTQDPKIVEVVFKAIINKKLEPSKACIQKVIQIQDQSMVSALKRAGVELNHFSQNIPILHPKNDSLRIEVHPKNVRKMHCFYLTCALGFAGFAILKILIFLEPKNE